MQHTPLIGTVRRRGEQVTKVGLIKNNKKKKYKAKKTKTKSKTTKGTRLENYF